MQICLHCGSSLTRAPSRYCSNRCQLDYQYEQYIQNWQSGSVAGSRGINAKNISGHLKRYLRVKYGNKCTICGWSEVNTVTNRVPLEIDHIDGNSDNNTEENLRLICPNCHALTPNYRNLNRGKGRVWRRNKYLKIQ